jgi:hypothetical protein
MLSLTNICVQEISMTYLVRTGFDHLYADKAACTIQNAYRQWRSHHNNRVAQMEKELDMIGWQLVINNDKDMDWICMTQEFGVLSGFMHIMKHGVETENEYIEYSWQNNSLWIKAVATGNIWILASTWTGNNQVLDIVIAGLRPRTTEEA